MVDLILAVFVAATFAGGFWCGRTIPSLTAMLERCKQALKK